MILNIRKNRKGKSGYKSIESENKKLKKGLISFEKLKKENKSLNENNNQLNTYNFDLTTKLFSQDEIILKNQANKTQLKETNISLSEEIANFLVYFQLSKKKLDENLITLESNAIKMEK